jgi:hypothetical protein
MSRVRLLLPFIVAMVCFFLARSRPGRPAWFAIGAAILALGIVRVLRERKTRP